MTDLTPEQIQVIRATNGRGWVWSDALNKIEQLQGRVKELETSNSDKSQLLASFRSQVTDVKMLERDRDAREATIEMLQAQVKELEAALNRAKAVIGIQIKNGAKLVSDEEINTFMEKYPIPQPPYGAALQENKDE